MTRETKIGLLVGLAFIIVVGILLSEHYTGAMRPPEAALTVTADSARQGYAAPGMRRESPPGVNFDSVRPERQIAFDDRHPPRGSADIGVRREGGPPIRIESHDDRRPETPQDPERLPQPQREELVKDDGQTVPVVPVQQHKAEPGDNIYKLAVRYYGAGSKTNQDLILQANPQLGGKPTRMRAGEVYTIPPKEAAPTPQAPSPNANETRTPPTAPPERPGTFVSYTTKPGDNLWKIATEQCGSGSAANIARIKELNKEVLKGDRGDLVPINTVLKLPPKN